MISIAVPPFTDNAAAAETSVPSRDPVAALQRLMPHEPNLSSRVSDADAQDLLDALLDAVDEDETYADGTCSLHPECMFNRAGRCQGCPADADADADADAESD